MRREKRGYAIKIDKEDEKIIKFSFPTLLSAIFPIIGKRIIRKILKRTLMSII